MDDTPKKSKNGTSGIGAPTGQRQARAELIWEGKYDAAGRRVAPLRVALPFQTVETVNESAQERQKSLFAPGFREETWRNRLIWGDKKYVLPSLLFEFAGKVNLIYIDPPFDSGADFSFTATVPDDPDSDEDDSLTFTKEPSIIEHKAYRDTWGSGLNSYLQWIYEAVALLHDLLAQNGVIYVHLDPRVSHFAKVVMDEVFGPENFLNELVWKRTTTKNDYAQGAVNWPRIHEVILYYAKNRDARPTFVQPFSEYDEDYVTSKYPYTDADGRRFGLWDVTAPGSGTRGHPRYEVMGVTRFWRYGKEKMSALIEQGRIVQPSPGAVPRYKRFLDEMPGVAIGDVFTDIDAANSQARERLGYPTQKPEALLARLVKCSSNENDLVLDCFCGSGTTAAVAEKLNRRWIACDLGRFAIHTTRKRLLSISNVRPFIVQNLGKYERQAWAGAEFGEAQAAERQRAYIEFILKLAQATPLNGYTWLHGVKGGRMIHVGAVDAPVSVGDVTQIAVEFKRAIGTGKDAPKTNGIDVLGWDFAFEMNEVAKQQAAAANIQIRFLRIPRDVMDKRAVEQGDIKFFELGALSVDLKTSKREVLLKLKDFVIPPDDVPEDARKAVKHWSQWVDYWAVDWDNKDDTFHNEWQVYRTRKNKTLPLETSHAYTEAGEYTVVVKVIDILGNDTTKTVKVRVK